MGNSLFKNRRNQITPINYSSGGAIINEYYTPAHPVGPPPPNLKIPI